MSTCEMPGSGFDLSEIIQLIPELRRLAAMLMRTQSPAHTLQASALVNEAWLRLQGTERWKDKGHFVNTAGQAMRHVLIDHAKRKKAAKRPQDEHRTALEGLTIAGGAKPVDIEELEEGLQLYEQINPLNAQVVQLRFFFGMTHAEIAETLEIAERSSQRAWAQAKDWLSAFLADEDDDEG